MDTNKMIEKLNILRKKYGEVVVQLEDDFSIVLKPTIEFHEGLMLHSVKGEEEVVKFVMEEFPKLIAKSNNLSIEDAKILFLNYTEKILNEYFKAFGVNLDSKKN